MKIWSKEYFEEIKKRVNKKYTTGEINELLKKIGPVDSTDLKPSAEFLEKLEKYKID